MINIRTTTKFDRTFLKFLKKHPELKEVIANKIDLFINDPMHISLNTHNLKGALEDCWAFSLTYSYRIIFSWEENDVYFLNIGSHDEIY